MSRVSSNLIIVSSLCLVLGSCASEKTVSTHIDTKKMEEFLSQDGDKGEKVLAKLDSSFNGKRGEDGSAVMESDKRSAFEGARYGDNKDDFARKAYETKNFDDSSKPFERKNWDESSKSYTDSNLDSPDFIRKAAEISHDQTSLRDKAYATKSSQDQNRTWLKPTDKQIDRTVDEYTVIKRNELARPKIMSAAEQQMKSIEEVRNMMGRNSTE